MRYVWVVEEREINYGNVAQTSLVAIFSSEEIAKTACVHLKARALELDPGAAIYFNVRRCEIDRISGLDI